MPLLPKTERLYEQSLISMLFDKGGRVTASFPSGKLRGTYLLVSDETFFSTGFSGSGNCRLPDFSGKSVPARFPCCKIMVSAPKKHFKHAVDRNRVKRLLRENYRQRKEVLSGIIPAGKVLLLSLQYVGDKSVSLSDLGTGMEKLFRSLQIRFSDE